MFKLKHFALEELQKLDPQKTVFFFALGPLQNHGPHLPLEIDLLEAEKYCEMAASDLEKNLGWTPVLLPSAFLGIDPVGSPPFFSVRAHVLRDYLVDTCKNLLKAGFYQFVCFSGHLGPKQLTTIEEAGKMIGRLAYHPRWVIKKSKPYLISASSRWIPWQEVLRSPLTYDPLEHGGAIDTSIALALVPQLVHIESCPPEVQKPKNPFFFGIFLPKFQISYWGNPKAASAEYGAQILAKRYALFWEGFEKVLAGSNPNFLFRSYYSIIFPNQSFFKAWCLFGGICLFLGCSLKLLMH